MATYSTYKVNNNNITNILQDSVNRTENIVRFSGFKNSGSYISFASYDSTISPFYFDTGINSKYKNSFSEINKGYSANGFSPLLNERKYCVNKSTVTISFKGTGIATENGTLTIIQDSTTTVFTECPSVIVIAIQGSGGGGAGGGGYYSGKYSYGGGNGPFLIFHLELPYLNTANTEILKIELGAGGGGGGPWSYGGKGESTNLYVNVNGWKKIAELLGGDGGPNLDYGPVYSPTTELAITRINFFNSFDSQIYGNQQGYGRVSINSTCKSFDFGHGIFSYMPGNYFSPLKDTSYEQASYYTNLITAGNTTALNRLWHIGEFYIVNPKYVYQNFSTNVRFYGKYSIFGNGGAYSYGEGGGGTRDGYKGGIGAGGGGGSCANTIFDSGIGYGGAGGDAGVKIFW